MWRAFCKTLPCLFPFSPGPVTSSPLLLSLFIYLVLWIPYLNFCDSREQQPPARPSQGMPHLPSACEFFTGIKKYQYLTLPPHTTQKAGTKCKVKDKTEPSTFSKTHDGWSQLPAVAPGTNSTCAANFPLWHSLSDKSQQMLLLQKETHCCLAPKRQRLAIQSYASSAEK